MTKRHCKKAQVPKHTFTKLGETDNAHRGTHIRNIICVNARTRLHESGIPTTDDEAFGSLI